MENNTCLTPDQFKRLITKVNDLPKHYTDLIKTYEEMYPANQNYKTRYSFLKSVLGRRATKEESDDFLMAHVALNIMKNTKPKQG